MHVFLDCFTNVVVDNNCVFVMNYVLTRTGKQVCLDVESAFAQRTIQINCYVQKIPTDKQLLEAILSEIGVSLPFKFVFSRYYSKIGF